MYEIKASPIEDVMYEIKASPIEELDLLIRYLGKSSSRQVSSIKTCSGYLQEVCVSLGWFQQMY
jgi:hypothetical protein